VLTKDFSLSKIKNKRRRKGGHSLKQYLATILEDDSDYAQYLKECLTRYGLEHTCTFQIRVFGRAEAFLADDRRMDDVVFIDVDLGEGWMNGMEAARVLRDRGSMAVLFFITNMPQYAPDGYAVDAIDYCIKPIHYSSLSIKLDKALRILAQRTGVPVRIKTKEGFCVLSSSNIFYIEVKGHNLMFHTAQGVIHSYGGLSEREEELRDRAFARCSASVLVNLRYVSGIYGDELAVGEERIKIGRSKKKEFLIRLNQYLGG